MAATSSEEVFRQQAVADAHVLLTERSNFIATVVDCERFRGAPHIGVVYIGGVPFEDPRKPQGSSSRNNGAMRIRRDSERDELLSK